MIKKCFLAVVLAVSPVLSQSQELHQQMADFVCNCIDSISERTNPNPFSSCLEIALVEYEEEMVKEIMSSLNIDPSDTTLVASDSFLHGLYVNSLGKEQGAQLGDKVLSLLIESCELFTIKSNELRRSAYNEVDTHQIRLEGLTGQVEHAPSPDLYCTRGELYYAKNEVELAERDYRSSIAMDKNFPLGYICLAWLLEEQGRFRKAKKNYEKAYKISKLQLIKTYLELLRARKKIER